MPGSELVLDFTDDPRAFLVAAEPVLAADPVLTTVVSTATTRAIADDEAGVVRPNDHPRWWVSTRIGGPGSEVVGVAMRTAPFAPYPMFVLPMPEAAAVGLARALHARGEHVTAVNGVPPATRHLSEELARLADASTWAKVRTRLFELDVLAVPAPVPGRLRVATSDDQELALAWFNAFHVDAAAQAGRAGEHAMTEPCDGEDLERRITEQRIWLWEDETGEVVHLTGHNPPTFGVVRIGPVYTPPQCRQRGFASAAVAEVSRNVLAAGHRACLFTDQANPTSNRIYEALGYRRVVDMEERVLTT